MMNNSLGRPVLLSKDNLRGGRSWVEEGAGLKLGITGGAGLMDSLGYAGLEGAPY